jgi:hypothetical protein
VAATKKLEERGGDGREELIRRQRLGIWLRRPGSARFDGREEVGGGAGGQVRRRRSSGSGEGGEDGAREEVGGGAGGQVRRRRSA